MLTQMLGFLVDTIFSFFVFMLLARFHFQWLRVPFRNSLGQFILTVTSWMVMPTRRVVPSLAGFDLASLLLALLLQAGALALQALLRGADLGIAPGSSTALFLLVAAADLLRYSVYLLIFALIVQAVLSWTNPGSPLMGYFEAVVSPFLRPIRRLVPLIANFDLSPLVLLVILQVLLIPLNHLRGAIPGLL